MGTTNSKNILDFTEHLSQDKIKKYFTGVWHEQGRLYSYFERECRGSKASYKMLDDGTVSITNECLWGNKKTKITGSAFKKDKNTQIAAFNVKFPWVPMGSYYILYTENIDNDKGLAFVASDNFEYFWVLTRNKNRSKEHICKMLIKLNLPIDYGKIIWNDGEPCFEIDT